MRIICNNLRWQKGREKWGGLVFSFEDAIFDYGDLSGAHFEGGYVNFHGAQFVDRSLFFSNVIFEDTGVAFTGSQFGGAEVHFDGVQFKTKRKMRFDGASILGAVVTFQGADAKIGTRLGPFEAYPDF